MSLQSDISSISQNRKPIGKNWLSGSGCSATFLVYTTFRTHTHVHSHFRIRFMSRSTEFSFKFVRFISSVISITLTWSPWNMATRWISSSKIGYVDLSYYNLAPILLRILPPRKFFSAFTTKFSSLSPNQEMSFFIRDILVRGVKVVVGAFGQAYNHIAYGTWLSPTHTWMSVSCDMAHGLKWPYVTLTGKAQGAPDVAKAGMRAVDRALRRGMSLHEARQVLDIKENTPIEEINAVCILIIISSPHVYQASNVDLTLPNMSLNPFSEIREDVLRQFRG